jgi:hypothetical protein
MPCDLDARVGAGMRAVNTAPGIFGGRRAIVD